MIGRYFGSAKSNIIGRYFGATKRNVHAFSREIIKPSSSPPHHLKHYNLSPMDQIMFRNYMPIVFFFPSSHEKVADKSRRLKQSLSETLTAYYPFAGRLTSRASVDCNDKGIEFQESRIASSLSETVKKYDEDLDLDLVFPPNSAWGTFDNESSPMIVRVNHFACGGVAIAMCMSHIIADACTFSNFMNDWAAVTRQSGDRVLPHFVSSPSDNADFQESPLAGQNLSLTRKKFVFKNTELADLKAKVRSPDGQNPTRFEFLAALFYRCAMAVEKSKSGFFNPSVMFHPVNMRRKVVPAVPKTTMGNWIWRPSIKARTESESSWSFLIEQSKKEKAQMEGMKCLDVNVFKSIVMDSSEKNYKMYFCTSMCNLDLEKVNFGWGNPVRVGLGDSHVGDAYAFFDTPSGDGIQVVACFEEQEMLKNEVEKEVALLHSIIN